MLYEKCLVIDVGKTVAVCQLKRKNVTTQIKKVIKRKVAGNKKRNNFGK